MNVRVVARIRPLSKYELQQGAKEQITPFSKQSESLNNALLSSLTQMPDPDDPLSPDGDPELLQVSEGSSDQQQQQQQQGGGRYFEVDAVFGADSSQHECYHKSGAARAVTEDIFKGYNTTILAYGQTGAGKTHTMGSCTSKVSLRNTRHSTNILKSPTSVTAQMNDDDDDVNSDAPTHPQVPLASAGLGEHEGMIPRACADLFDTIATKCDGNATVTLSYLEIYNEEIRDLLTPNNNSHTTNSSSMGGNSAHGNNSVRNNSMMGANNSAHGNNSVRSSGTNNTNSALKIRETMNGEIYVSGLSSQEVSSMSDVGRLMEEAAGRRVTAATQMNAVSSRSHAICTLHVSGILSNEGNNKFASKLTLVDLAGSERSKKTGAQGDRQKEGISINKGLFVLGQVVSALSAKGQQQQNQGNNNAARRSSLTSLANKKKPPYRDSKLTRLLQDSLGGNSRTIMVACVSPADVNLDESINTLRYATSARNIQNTATRNMVQQISPEEAAALQRENQLLQQQVAELQDTLDKITMAPPGQYNHANNDDDSSVGGNSAHTAPLHNRQQHLEHKKKMKKYEKKIESLTRQLKASKEDLRLAKGETAVALPQMKMNLALAEEQLRESKDYQTLCESLQDELEEAKADASSANHAASKLNAILNQLKELKMDEINKKKVDYMNMQKEEAWVSFVYQMMARRHDQLKQLSKDFTLVSKAAAAIRGVIQNNNDEKRRWFRTSSPHGSDSSLEGGQAPPPEPFSSSSSTSSTCSSSSQKKQQKQNQQHLLLQQAVEKKRGWFHRLTVPQNQSQQQQQQPLNQHPSQSTSGGPEEEQMLQARIDFFQTRLEVLQADVREEALSLKQTQESLKEDRAHLQKEIGTTQQKVQDVGPSSSSRSSNDVLKQLTSLLVSPSMEEGEA